MVRVWKLDLTHEKLTHNTLAIYSKSWTIMQSPVVLKQRHASESAVGWWKYRFSGFIPGNSEFEPLHLGLLTCSKSTKGQLKKTIMRERERSLKGGAYGMHSALRTEMEGTSSWSWGQAIRVEWGILIESVVHWVSAWVACRVIIPCESRKLKMI